MGEGRSRGKRPRVYCGVPPGSPSPGVEPRRPGGGAPGRPVLGDKFAKGPFAPGKVQVAEAVEVADTGGAPAIVGELGGVVIGDGALGAAEGAVVSGAFGVTGESGETVPPGAAGRAGTGDGSGVCGNEPAPSKGSVKPGVEAAGVPAGRTIASICALVSLIR